MNLRREVERVQQGVLGKSRVQSPQLYKTLLNRSILFFSSPFLSFYLHLFFLSQWLPQVFLVSPALVCLPTHTPPALAHLFLLGAFREVKKAVEAYWAGKISADELNNVASEVKKFNWTSLKERNVDFVPRLFNLPQFDSFSHVANSRYQRRLYFV